MPFGGLLTAGVLAGGGAIAGGLAQSSATKRQNDLLSQAMGDQQTFDPELLKQKIYQKYAQGEILAPEMQQAIAQVDSQAAQAKADPQAVAAQKQALMALQQQSRVGMTPQERAEMYANLQDVAKAQEANRQQVLQNLQQRGQGGSGAELAAALSGSQNAASTGAQNAIQASANAGQARMNALSGMSNLASGMRTSSFGEGLATGQAKDVLNKFNTQNLRDVQGANVGAKNAAQQFNINRANTVSDQNIANANKAIDDQEKARYARMGVDASNIGLRNQARSGMGAAAAQQGANQARMWNSLGQLGGGLAMKGFGSGSSNSDYNSELGSED